MQDRGKKQREDRETPMIKAWAASSDGVTGRLHASQPGYELVHGAGVAGQEFRWVDGIARHDRPAGWCNTPAEFGSVTGVEITLIQAKRNSLGFPLLGQAFFSRELANSPQHLGAKVVRTVALCTTYCEPLYALGRKAGVDIQCWDAARSKFTFSTLNNNNNIERLGRMLRARDIRPGFPILTGCRYVDSRRTHSHSIHAVIFLDGEWEPTRPSLDGRQLVVVTNPPNFGMWALGMAYFGRRLVEECHAPRFLRSLILTAKVDPAMQLLAKTYDIDVVDASTLQFVVGSRLAYLGR